MQNISEIFIRYRSLVGGIGLIAALWLASPTARSIFFGFFLIILGMVFRGWSSGYINKDRELATEGPFALTRNPLYFGNLLLAVGIAIACHNLYSTIICIGFYVVFFPFLIVIERKRMKARFGRQYEQWAKHANLFFPRIGRIGKGNFNISFYMKNREYRVLFFSLFVIAMLIIKYLKGIYSN